LFYSYVSKSMWWRLPRPIVRNFAADLKHLHSLGIRRYYCQSRLSDWVTDGPLYYVLAQLMWDPSLDPEALAADWITHMFGEAAPAMAKFYADVEASVKSTGQSYSDNPPRHVPGLYDPKLLQSAMRRLDEALALAKTPETEQRVREVRKIFRYGCLVISGLENIHAYTANADPEAATAGRRDIDQALKIYNRGEVRKFRAQLRFTEAMGVVAKGWSDIQKKGGKKCWNTDETGVGDNRAGWATFLLRMPRDNKGALVRMLVWGESELPTITINTGGQGKSYADKGIWTPVAPRAPLDGNPAWQWLEFDIPRGTLAPGDAPATLVGMGGSDSQIWVAKIEIQPLDK
ncbi:MAG: DUF4838 domain-containing protein, partial [Lentisphaeria bacterium]|nr:DUF4838 domain-containing protein [Lentisphaeria bacterium]